MTGDPGLCRAGEDNCPFGSADDHFTSKEAARSAYEAKGSKLFEARVTLDKLRKVLVTNEDLGWDAISFYLDSAERWEEDWTDDDFKNLGIIQELVAFTQRKPFTKKNENAARQLLESMVPYQERPKTHDARGLPVSDDSYRARDKVLNELAKDLIVRSKLEQLPYESVTAPTSNDRLIGLEAAQEQNFQAANFSTSILVESAPYYGRDAGDYLQESIARVVRGDEPATEILSDSQDVSLLPVRQRVFHLLHPRSPIHQNSLYLATVFPVNELKKEMDRLGLDGVTVTAFKNGRESGNVYTVIQPDGITRSFSVYEHRNTDSIIINGKANWQGGDDLAMAGDSSHEFFAEFPPDDRQRAASALTYFMKNAQAGKLESDAELASKAPKRDWIKILSDDIPGFGDWAKKRGYEPRKDDTPEDVLSELDFAAPDIED